MRRLVFICVLGACGNDPDPRLIAGGGVGDGPIDGTLNVFAIDNATEQPLVGASVAVGDHEGTTDATGLFVVKDVDGPQTIAIKAAGYRSTVWADVDGANVTIPVTALETTPDQATLSGSITNWSSVSVPTGHLKAAFVVYSQSDSLGDPANNIQTPNSGNVCGVAGGATCDWTVASRTGTVSLAAAIIDLDPKGTADQSDDTMTIIGWAIRTGIVVEDGVNQSGLALEQVEAGNLQNVTIDLGTPPAALTTTAALVGIEVGSDEVVQLPIFLATDKTTALVPQPAVFAADATYRLTAIAQTASGDQGAQSIVLRQGLAATTALSAGDWLVPPTGITVSRTEATFEPVEGALLGQVSWSDATQTTILQITLFDPVRTAVVPPLVALPTSGTLTARAAGIGADLDPQDFSLEVDKHKLFGIAAQPMPVP
jgi:hypothetical protein